MKEDEFLAYDIGKLIQLFRRRHLSPVEVTRACLDRIASFNERLSAYITVLAEDALNEARKAEHAFMQGHAGGILQGVPISVKDVFETKDAPTTWGSRELAEHFAPEDSTVVSKLHEAGAIILGKTNVDMYPYDGLPFTPRLIGPTRNPWDLNRTAGLSSGGSGASVAACLDYGSVGTDNGGSIRIPAALCGVVGLKPTFGLVSRHRVFPYSVSFDHCGPIARSVLDCALLFSAIAGHDPRDPSTVDRPLPDYRRGIGNPVQGLYAGLPRKVAWESNSPDVTRLVDEAVVVLQGLGVTMKEIDLPFVPQALWTTVVSVAETHDLVEGLRKTPNPLNAYVDHLASRAVMGRKDLLRHGMAIRNAARAKFEETFRDIDFAIMPTVPTTAPRFSDSHSSWQRPEESFSEVLARYTSIFNLTHWPAITLPCGFASDGMPVGLQIAAPPFGEEILFRAAYGYERETGWSLQHPLLR